MGSCIIFNNANVYYYSFYDIYNINIDEISIMFHNSIIENFAIISLLRLIKYYRCR